MKIIEVMCLKPSQYFTDEQLEKMRRQSESLGHDKMMGMANEWPELIAKVRAKMESRTPVEDPEVAELVRRWKELTDLLSGGDEELIRAAERFQARIRTIRSGSSWTGSSIGV
ncbi:hypothetical protein GE107_23175 [Cohnella sp. CFH 77786]|uniref:TipAS antibiotic-recognition domain-containing protein n=1 Tax=Cohnella sp. CFH 77786 TaxID=2662265 RepID=UPI001C608F23|nr:TipAS antibiotic-recognition domain-containing protein [Cohnella sp. CFH 77786]MBW5448946.1 hypothetical protein [Cohnella sp. CFH 77786]